jgi:hypothetical protein
MCDLDQNVPLVDLETQDADDHVQSRCFALKLP